MQSIADDVPQAKPHIATLRGGLEPALLEAEDGFSYVLKSTDNLHGPITAFKESTGAELYRRAAQVGVALSARVRLCTLETEALRAGEADLCTVGNARAPGALAQLNSETGSAIEKKGLAQSSRLSWLQSIIQDLHQARSLSVSEGGTHRQLGVPNIGGSTMKRNGNTRILKLAATLLALVAPAFASSISVSMPSNGATVTSPIQIVAASSFCPSNNTAAMGYSFDDSDNTTITPTSFNTFALVSNGTHILHVKCWGNGGGADVVNLTLYVVSGKAGATPANSSQKVSNIQNLSNWTLQNDPDSGSGAWTSGTMTFPASLTLNNRSREFGYWYTNYGGELFYAWFPDDLVATHFIYDAQVYPKNLGQTAVVEMDLNQVMSNGQTVIFGFQCDGWTKTWDYTVNAGTPTAPIDTWIHSTATCTAPSAWTSGWHHIQIAYQRDAYGNVKYTQVGFDGVVQDMTNATGNSAFALGWEKVLLTNFQLDGNGASGAGNAIIDNLTLYKW